MKYSRKTLFYLENKTIVHMIFSYKIPCIYTDTIGLVTVETIFIVVILAQTIKWHDCYKIQYVS